MGVIDFEFLGNPEHLEVHVFEARTFSGTFELPYNADHIGLFHLEVDII